MCDSNDTKCFVFYGFLAGDCQQRMGLLPAPGTHRYSQDKLLTNTLPTSPPSSLPLLSSRGFTEGLIGRLISLFPISADYYYFFDYWGEFSLTTKNRHSPCFFKLKSCTKVFNGTKTEPVPRAGLLQRDNAQFINLH